MLSPGPPELQATLQLKGEGGSQGCIYLVRRVQASPQWVGTGDQSHGCFYSQRDGFTDLTAAQLFVAMGAAIARRLELCAPPPLWLLGSRGLQTQLPQLGVWDCRCHLHCSPSSTSSVCSSPPAVRCTNVWSSRVSW